MPGFGLVFLYEKIEPMVHEFVHKRLHAPYTLHVEVLQSPRRPKRTFIMLHGIGSSTRMWHNVASQLPDNIRIIAIDLLGFGQSPDPGWVKYDARTQVNSIIATLLLHRVPLKSVVVGHSLGALVAVELARRFPLYVSKLVLISPPIYKPSRGKGVATQKEDILRGVYEILYKNPESTEKALRLARKYYVKRTGANVPDGLNVDSFLGALKSAVINQSAIDHIGDVTIPVSILSGSRDPVIVSRNLNKLAQQNTNIEHIVIKKAGHNVVGIMEQAVVQYLTTYVSKG